MEKFSLLSDNSQFSSASAVYNVGGLCRTIVPVLGETDAHQFLVGTANVRKPNEVHLVEYDDADNVITCKTVIQHAAGEIVGLFPNPVRRELFFVVYTDASSFVREGALLSLNQQAEPASREGADGRQGDGKTVVCPPAFQLPAIEGFGDLVCVVWKPAVEIDDSFAVDEIGADGAEDDEGELTFGGRVAGGAAVDTEGEHTFVSVYTNGFQVWDIMVDDHEGTQLQPRENARAVMWGSSPEDGNVGTVTAAAWDPHHKDLIVLAVGGDLVTFNVETLAEIRRCARAHDARITSIDFNSNKPWAVLSSDCSGCVRFWDIRKASVASVVEAADGAAKDTSTTNGNGNSKSLKVIKAHSHWVTSAQYNPAHDQLVLTSSTDQLVKLWRVSSISSAPLMELDDAELALSSNDSDSEDVGGNSESSTSGFRFPGDNAGATAADVLVKDFADHEDSVYDIAWSACESWVFASVSHAGRVIVGSVPSSEKYKILL
eukprot:INCI5766.1.p1 GENE.INCI5766.1~~INCI5766.1.p1  ORF type:complete len:563 (+),score=86.07 INCI5766.1:224-1690(+)